MLESSNPITADQNNMTEIFDSNRREWRVVTGGPTISDYGIISLSKLGVYIFGGVHILQGYSTHMPNIYRFNEGKSLKFTWISLLPGHVTIHTCSADSESISSNLKSSGKVGKLFFYLLK